MTYNEQLNQIAEAQGVDVDSLPDNLYSTKLKAIAESAGGGGNDSNSETIADHETRITALESAGGGSLKWKKLNSLAELKSNLNADNLGKLVKIVSKTDTSLAIPGSLSFCVPVSYDNLSFEGLGKVYYIKNTTMSPYGTTLYFVTLIIPNTSSPTFAYYTVKSTNGTFSIESSSMTINENTFDIYIEE